MSGAKKQELTIGVDTWVLGAYARNHGVHEYTAQLLTRFRELAAHEAVQIRPYVSAGTDNDANAFGPAPGFQPRQTKLLGHSRLWRYGGACTLAALQRVDLVFNPHCLSLYAGGLVAAVTTIHDLIPAIMPGPSRVDKTLRFLLRRAAASSRAIITVSECSKRDLVNIYGAPESKIFVVYNGCDHSTFNSAPLDPNCLKETLLRVGIGKPYLLHYGAMKPNKNLKRLVLAYRMLMERNQDMDFDLVLAGTPGTSYHELLAVIHNNAGAHGRIILTGALERQDLVRVVKGARLAVFPSLYEGFCMPMVESMACGTPTIASSSSCLPEISGGVLRYFDPLSEAEMSCCMEAVLKSEELRCELSDKGRRRAAQFNWRCCAEQTLAILKNTAKKLSARPMAGSLMS